MLSAMVALVSCRQNPANDVYVADYQAPQNSVTVTPEVANLGNGLDLQMLGELVRNSSSAQDVEDKLNSNGSINNLDLDNDGNVDYIKVTEYGDGNNRGLSFTVDMPNGQTQEVATVELNRMNNNVAMNIQGNNTLYGGAGYYTSHYTLGDILLMHYLFAPHRYYVSPYRYGYYPRTYHSYHIVPVTSYRSRVVTSTRTTRIVRTTRPSVSSSRITSPNANRYSTSVTNRARSISRPTTSQKSFSVTNNSRPNTSGFGNSSARRTSSSSYGSSYSSRPSSSSSSYSSSYSSRPSSSSSYSSRPSSSSSSYRSSSSFGSSSRSSYGGSRSSFRSGRR